MNSITFNSKRITPSKVVCIGRNYIEHIKELDNETPKQMVIFNKANSAISEELHYFSPDTRFEGELCFLIESNKISGIGFGLDLTKANIQSELKNKGLPWERAKAFDGSAIFSEFKTFTGDIAKVHFELFINEKLIQIGNYELMINKPHKILEEINSFMSLEDGDILMTGTPKGVSSYKIGDTFLAKVYEGDSLVLQSQWIVKG